MQDYYCFSVPTIRCVMCKQPICDAIDRHKEKLHIERREVDETEKKLHLWLKDNEHIGGIDIFQSIQAILDEIGHECKAISKFSYYLPNLSPEQTTDIEELIKGFKDLNISKVEIHPKKKTIAIEVNSFDFSEYDFFLEISRRLKRRDIGITDPITFKKMSQSNWFLGWVGIGFGFGLMIFCMFAPPLPLLVHLGIAFFSTLLTLYLGKDSFKAAFKSGRHFTMDSLFSLSTLVVLTTSIASLFIPGLPMMFESGLLIFGFRRLGIALEHRMKGLTLRKKLFRNNLPEEVTILENEQRIEKSVLEIKEGDCIELQPGDIVPVDGICLETILINNKNLTGQDDIVQINANAVIKAGTRIADHVQPTRIRATSTTKTSSLAKLDKHLLGVNSEKSPLEITISKIFKYFIPIVLVASILSGGLVGYFYGIALGIKCAVAVLVSACPCTLGMIVPLSINIGKARAEKMGVYFKTAKALEDAASIDAVVFDWNGTITNNTAVARHEVYDGFEENDLLSYANVIESSSKHAVASAIQKYTLTFKDKITPKTIGRVQKFQSGVSAEIDGQEVMIGNQAIMQQHHIDTQDLIIDLKPGESIIYLACGRRVKGSFVVSSPPREDAQYVIKTLMNSKLESMNSKKVLVCTGTHINNIARDAKDLGIDARDIHTECAANPDVALTNQEDKVTIIKNLPGRVAMIGDWSNDSLAVKESDFSIAIQQVDTTEQGEEDQITQQNASAIIKDGSLMPVLTAFVISEETVKNIKQNLMFSLIYNVVSMSLASGIFLKLGLMAINPGLCVALMVLQSVVIFYNAYRLKDKPLKHLEHHEPLLIGVNSYQRMGPILDSAHSVCSLGPREDLATRDPQRKPLFSNQCKEQTVTSSADNISLLQSF